MEQLLEPLCLVGANKTQLPKIPVAWLAESSNGQLRIASHMLDLVFEESLQRSFRGVLLCITDFAATAGTSAQTLQVLEGTNSSLCGHVIDGSKN